MKFPKRAATVLALLALLGGCSSAKSDSGGASGGVDATKESNPAPSSGSEAAPKVFEPDFGEDSVFQELTLQDLLLTDDDLGALAGSQWAIAPEPRLYHASLPTECDLPTAISQVPPLARVAGEVSGRTDSGDEVVATVSISLMDGEVGAMAAWPKVSESYSCAQSRPVSIGDESIGWIFADPSAQRPTTDVVWVRLSDGLVGVELAVRGGDPALADELARLSVSRISRLIAPDGASSESQLSAPAEPAIATLGN